VLDQDFARESTDSITSGPAMAVTVGGARKLKIALIANFFPC